MTAFVKFDPWAALAAVRRGEHEPKTLAGLATLAGGHIKTENLDTAKAHGNKNQISSGTPAKAAKVAKVGLPVAEPFPFADALNELERRCPEYVEPDRWQQCVINAQRFLADWGPQAEALEWSSGDLFGLHEPPAKPHPSYHRLSRYDCTGLLWLLQGRRVIALTAVSAVIEGHSGNIVTYRKHRKPALGPLGDWLDDFVR